VLDPRVTSEEGEVSTSLVEALVLAMTDGKLPVEIQAQQAAAISRTAADRRAQFDNLFRYGDHTYSANELLTRNKV
jgi:hypothetical protein